MKQTIQLSLTILATLVCGAAFGQGPLKAPPHRGSMVPFRAPDMTDKAPAAPFYSNFGAADCNSCTYDSSGGGFYILDQNNCLGDSPQNIAYSFVATKSGTVKDVIVAVTLDNSGSGCNPSNTSFNVSIYDNLCTAGGAPANAPGTLLGTASVKKAPANPCATSKATFAKNKGPKLVSGNTYWVACEGNNKGSADFLGVWWDAFSSDVGYNETTTVGTGTYASFAEPNPGAFEVQ